jgi:hypothetical protein
VISAIIGINILISLLGFYAAWQIWCWRSRLARAAAVLADVERQSQQRLNIEALPQIIGSGWRGVAQGKQQYHQLQQQLHQLRQLLYLVGLLSAAWRWLFRGSVNPRRQGRR